MDDAQDDPTEATSQYGEAAERMLDQLQEMTELGMNVARELHRRLSDGADPRDIAAAYQKVSADVLQSIYLSSRIEKEREQAAARAERAARRAAPKPAPSRPATRLRALPAPEDPPEPKVAVIPAATARKPTRH